MSENKLLIEQIEELNKLKFRFQDWCEAFEKGIIYRSNTVGVTLTLSEISQIYNALYLRVEQLAEKFEIEQKNLLERE